ncbi:MAG: DUF4830 domain-containing protein [Oscillospiraceae bacterium]|nr:DUF4830 domain-containing protein [Oscillospiraceae bacterium]
MSVRSRISLKGFIIMFAILAAAFFLVKCTVSYVSAALGEVTQEDAAQFLTECGWKLKPDSASREEVMIPAEFSEVYERYNNLQKKQGYDLSAYKGEKVVKYTFQVLNFTEYDGSPCDNAEAHLLVWGGEIIGGDVCSLSISGRMVGVMVDRE